jgi:hypothetical protein
MADPASKRDDRNSIDKLSTKESETTALLDSSAATDDTRILGGQDVSVRAVVGGAMHGFSQVINDNLIAARYGVMASMFLLTAYGLSNTPLFFRFRTVSEIPGKKWTKKGMCLHALDHPYLLTGWDFLCFQSNVSVVFCGETQTLWSDHRRECRRKPRIDPLDGTTLISCWSDPSENVV